MTIKNYPNQKTWIDGSIHTKMKVRTTASNHGKVTGNMVEYKQCCCKQSKGQNVSTETKWSRNSMAQTRDVNASKKRNVPFQDPVFQR